MPYVLGFVGVLVFAEMVWQIGLYGVIRVEGHGIENLYVIGMDAHRTSCALLPSPSS
jgi:ATP-binding cassette, subfamily B, bacterial